MDPKIIASALLKKTNPPNSWNNLCPRKVGEVGDSNAASLRELYLPRFAASDGSNGACLNTSGLVWTN